MCRTRLTFKIHQDARRKGRKGKQNKLNLSTSLRRETSLWESHDISIMDDGYQLNLIS